MYLEHQASAQNVAWMLCARLINGIGTGHLNAIVPVWSAETSGHHSRGTGFGKRVFSETDYLTRLFFCFGVYAQHLRCGRGVLARIWTFFCRKWR
jgi:hypothetical protein